MNLFLAEADLVKHIVDHPWGEPGSWVDALSPVKPLMSSAIATMLLAALIVLAFVLPLARRYQAVPRGGRNVLEVLVIFVRDMIARPALHDKAYPFLPFLCTLFMFVLAMNVIGIVPLAPLTNEKLGGTPTAIMAVCAGLASISLVTIVVISLRSAARRFHEHHHSCPLVVCAILSPLLWIKSLAPSVPGVAGKVLYIPLMMLELVGFFGRCFALMIRLFANMVAGHTMLAVLVMIGLEAAAGVMKGSLHGLYVTPITFLASVAIDVMELLVAGIQAYVFTFLTAIFLGIYAEPAH